MYVLIVAAVCCVEAGLYVRVVVICGLLILEICQEMIDVKNKNTDKANI